MTMHVGLIAIGPEETISTILAESEEKLRALGAIAGAYHMTPAFHSQVSNRTVVAHFGFSARLGERYLEREFFEANPIPDLVMQAGHAMTWKEAHYGHDLSEPQRAFLRECVEEGITEGIAVPLFGSNSRNSYAAISFGRPVHDVSEGAIVEAIQYAQSAHQRICTIIDRDTAGKVRLSGREKDVLYWMAQGKSNNDIATILGISKATTDMFTARLFGKLGVNDRVTAVIEGLSRGLIQMGAP
ncbi:MAG: LuxR C-terminal-related transcriptional regulator [Novosphingobium sp.]